MNRAILIGVCILSVLVPGVASADGMLTPFLGVNFGGKTGALSDDSKVVYGASISFGGNVAAFEIDFGFSPDFLGDDALFTADNNLTTLMGNIMVGALDAPVRPYVVGGLGLLRTRVDSAGGLFRDITRNDFGFNLGAGLAGMFGGGNVGIRGDIRYFRSLQADEDDDFDLDIFDLGTLDFWRATVGITFAW